MVDYVMWHRSEGGDISKCEASAIKPYKGTFHYTVLEPSGWSGAPRIVLSKRWCESWSRECSRWLRTYTQHMRKRSLYVALHAVRMLCFDVPCSQFVEFALVVYALLENQYVTPIELSIYETLHAQSWFIDMHWMDAIHCIPDLKLRDQSSYIILFKGRNGMRYATQQGVEYVF